MHTFVYYIPPIHAAMLIMYCVNSMPILPNYYLYNVAVIIIFIHYYYYYQLVVVVDLGTFLLLLFMNCEYDFSFTLNLHQVFEYHIMLQTVS